MYFAVRKLHEMQARYYDPVIGRFLSIDPVTFMDTGNPSYFNRYAYCSSDPINCIDPNGESGVGLTDADYERFSQADIAPPTKEELKDIGIALLPGSGLASAKSNLEEGNYGMAAFDVATEIPLLKLGKLGKLGKAGCCFVAGTLVDTEDGLRPIEEIKIGDLVLSRNPETGATAYKEVTAIIPRHDRIIWTVGLSGENGASENFETTDEHPWWVITDAGDGNWKRTDELITGMIVTTADNQTMTIVSAIETEFVDGTYNITVADFETYFVGLNKVLVHNCKNLTKKSNVGDEVRTPDNDPDSFSNLGGGQGMKDTKTGYVWQKSKTNHSGDPVGEYKVGTKKGQAPTKGNKMTVTRSNSCVSKKDGC